MFKLISLLLISLILIILQLGFLPGLSYDLSLLINLPLIFIAMMSFFYDYETALVSAILMGLFLDFYTGFFFGFSIILLVLIVVIIKFVLKTMLQHKNLLSLLAIVVLTIFIWQFIHALLAVIIAKFNNLSLSNLNSKYFLYQLYQFIIHPLVIFILYKLLPILRKNLKGDLLHLIT